MPKKMFISFLVFGALALILLRQVLLGHGRRYEMRNPSSTWKVKEGRLVRVIRDGDPNRLYSTPVEVNP